MTRSLLLVSLVLGLATLPAAAAGRWSEAAATIALDAQGPQPQRYRSLQLDLDATREALREAVAAASPFALPHPDGGMAEFVLEDSGTMSPGLAARFPQIVSLRGRDADGNGVRVDLSDLGLQAMVFDRDGSWIVQPVRLGTGRDYISFRRSDSATSATFHCATHDRDETMAGHVDASPGIRTVTGSSRRVLRTAVGTTGEYGQFFGGTVALAQAAVVTAINRINEVYGKEFSVTMQLVANNNLLIFTNASIDPYTNNNGSALMNENQSWTDTVIGPANYDIGHVFSTAGGGVGSLNSVCNDATKARGTTGMLNPVGDPFYIDYVAHEIGHQYGGLHTFNSTLSGCNNSRTASAAYEPGSGSTIMSYAGICGSDNLQSNSDPYFHAHSIERMQTRLDAVPTCGSSTPNPSSAPVIAPMTTSYAIPVNTPFALTAPLVTDADGDVLTYAWEEMDLGAVTAVNVDNGSSPIIRSRPALPLSSRTVPRLAELFANTTATGEILPTQNRASMKFRLTVRDNHAGGGRSTSADLPGIQVVASAGPFVVSAPNTAVSWQSGVAQTVTWSVAGTTSAPISCANVDIALTRNTGASWVTLATGVPNDGGHAIVIPPGNATTQARIRVSCTNNLFFDVSNVNFTITEGELIFRNGFN